MLLFVALITEGRDAEMTRYLSLPRLPLRQVPSKPAPEKDFFRRTAATLAGRSSFPSNYNVTCNNPDVRSLCSPSCYAAFHGSPDHKAATAIVSCTIFVGSRKIELLLGRKSCSFTAMGCRQFLQYANQVRIIRIVFNL